jgi:dephospho-CoA kinase
MNNIILEQKIRKHLQEVLNEFKVFPQSGYCLILVGGPASGKTFLRNNIVPINGKIFDFDDFYKKYKQINDKVNRKESGEKLKQIEKLFLCNQEKI